MNSREIIFASILVAAFAVTGVLGAYSSGEISARKTMHIGQGQAMALCFSGNTYNGHISECEGFRRYIIKTANAAEAK